MLLFDLKEHISADFGFLSPIRVKVIFLESVISCDHFWILRHFDPPQSQISPYEPTLLDEPLDESDVNSLRERGHAGQLRGHRSPVGLT